MTTEDKYKLLNDSWMNDEIYKRLQDEDLEDE